MTKQLSSLRAPLCALLVSGCLMAAGCGGGGSSQPPANLGAAQANLNALVRSSAQNTSGLTVASLTPIAAQFDSARKASPNNKDAQTGYAISEAALAGLQFAQIFGVTSAGGTQTTKDVPANASHVAQLAQSLALWQLPHLIATGNVALPRATDFVPSLGTGAAVQAQGRQAHAVTNPTPAQVQTNLVSLDTSLANVEQALAVVNSDPNYTYTLADPSDPTNTGKTVKVGSVELHLLLGLVNALRGAANAGLAYNADPGSFDFNAAVGDLSGKSALTPAQYLPGGTFATLNSDGKARLNTTEQEINNLANNGIFAIDTVQTRTGTGYLIEPGNVVITKAQYNDVETQIKKYQGYLTSAQTVPITVGNTTTQTQLNLPAFFANPPADLKALLPTLAVSPSQYGDGSFDLTRQNYPDPTFGGLFPSGLPVNPSSLYVYPGQSGYTGTTNLDVINFALSFG